MNNEMNPAWLRQWDKFPGWIKGLGFGGATEAENGGSGDSDCECKR